VNIDRNYLIGGGVAVVLVLAGLAYFIWGTSGGGTDIASGECKAKETFDITAADYVLGKADAPVTIVEYASMTCPHCARFSRDVFPLLKENYVDKGHVRYVYREFPLDRVALMASVVGRCLQKDAYIPYVELMYGELETWGRSEDPRAAIKEMARRAGMSGDEFEKCVSTEDDAKKVIANQEAAVKDYCVNSTPYFFMNGKKLTAGEIPWSELDEKVRTELKAKGVTLPDAPAAPSETPAGTVPEGSPTPASPESSTGPAAPASETPATPTETPPNP
jgi:protein-disulfide isomerase